MPGGARLGHPEPTAIDLISQEARKARLTYSAEHDDEHDNGQLAIAAAAYLLFEWDARAAVDYWPFEESFRPLGRERALVRAGALVVAEIERLHRARQSDPRG